MADETAEMKELRDVFRGPRRAEAITDSMVAHFMSKKAIDLVVVGADRIARNADTANKIGTYGLACIAAAHDVPFYVAAPWSTVDLGCASGDAIPIEERPERELSHVAMPDGSALQLVPDGVRVRNPSFDVTPHALIAAIVTERGHRLSLTVPRRDATSPR